MPDFTYAPIGILDSWKLEKKLEKSEFFIKSHVKECVYH